MRYRKPKFEINEYVMSLDPTEQEPINVVDYMWSTKLNMWLYRAGNEKIFFYEADKFEQNFVYFDMNEYDNVDITFDPELEEEDNGWNRSKYVKQLKAFAVRRNKQKLRVIYTSEKELVFIADFHDYTMNKKGIIRRLW